MSFFLVLFFTSAIGITALVGRKVYALRHTEVHVPRDIDFTIDVPDFEEVKNTLIKKSRRYGYVALVVTIRLYVLGTHATKHHTRQIVKKIKERLNKRHTAKPTTHKSENKFLKKVTEYKNRIEKIKEQIKTEEGLN
ncbi:MAG: hypothetical protein ACK4FA_01285 [Candidatus Paceibacteria bacterium]